MDKSFSTRFKKDIVISLAFVSDKIIHFFTTQSVILQLILSPTLNIVVLFGGIHLILIYIKLKSYREEPVN